MNDYAVISEQHVIELLNEVARLTNRQLPDNVTVPNIVYRKPEHIKAFESLNPDHDSLYLPMDVGPEDQRSRGVIWYPQLSEPDYGLMGHELLHFLQDLVGTAPHERNSEKEASWLQNKLSTWRPSTE